MAQSKLPSGITYSVQYACTISTANTTVRITSTTKPITEVIVGKLMGTLDSEYPQHRRSVERSINAQSSDYKVTITPLTFTL
jgi:hypothetical protein